MDKRIVIQLNQGNKIVLHSIYRVSILGGKTSSGKSYMCNLIRQAQDDPSMIVESNVNIHDILIWDKEDDIDITVSNKIIIIDRFSLLQISDKRLTDFVNNSNNRFYLITHSDIRGIDIPANAEYVLTSSLKNGVIKTNSYMETAEAWFGVPSSEILELYKKVGY